MASLPLILLLMLLEKCGVVLCSGRGHALVSKDG